MLTFCLPSRPNVEHLKGQARILQRQVRTLGWAEHAGRAEVVELLRPLTK